MKLTLTTAFLLIINIQLFAQDKTITRDTINLRGIVIESDGKPASNITIWSQTKITAVTDNKGQFVLNGIMPNDTLTVYSIENKKQYYTNNGSRFMIINLPMEIEDVSAETPVEITAIRTKTKVIPNIASLDKTPKTFIAIGPEFPGGNARFLFYIQRVLIYPQSAVENNIEGTVQVMFTVKEDGALTDFVLIKGIGYGCDEAAIQLLQKSPKWKPGIQNSLPVAIRKNVSIKFSLRDK